MGKVTVYLPDDLEEDLDAAADNRSEFVQKAVKKELGYPTDDPEQTIVDRLDEIERRLEHVERNGIILEENQKLRIPPGWLIKTEK